MAQDPCRCLDLERRIQVLESALLELQIKVTGLATPNDSVVENEQNAQDVVEQAENGESSKEAEDQENDGPADEQPSDTKVDSGRKHIQFIQITYDENDLKVEKEVEEETAVKGVDSNAQDSDGFKMIVKYDVRNQETGIQLVDEGLRSLIMLATRKLRPTTDDTFETLWSPFCDFIYCWKELNDLASMDPNTPIVKELHEKIANTTADSHPYGTYIRSLYLLKDENRLNDTIECVRKLLTVVKEAPVMQPYFRGDETPFGGSRKVGWPWIWTVFVPGDLVIYKNPEDPSQDQIMLVRWENQIEYILANDTEGDEYYVKCWAYDWDPIGRVFKLVAFDIPIPYFHTPKNITSLDVFPISYLDPQERESRLKALTSRGRTFHDICTKAERFNYTGLITPSPPKASSGKNESVMVDFEAYLQSCWTRFSRIPIGDLIIANTQPYSSALNKENDALQSNQRAHYHMCKPESEDNKWEEEQFLLLPGRVVGYQLKAKRWCELQVVGLERIPAEMQQNDSAFNQLQLEKKSKDMIKSLIESHKTRASRGTRQIMADFIENKGDGLVILLHGEPGTGKTFTAESLAKATGRALYPIGPSDIGTDPNYIESKLEDHFRLASKWNAIMLFDEADVFLEQRRGNDTSLDRNAAVSILLRVLEYYDGILMLTTNRIRAIDNAIISRVTLAVLYQKIDEKRIFKSFVSQIKDESNKRKLERWLEDDEWQDDFTRSPLLDLNGRQIRNVLMATASLAQERHGGKIQISDLHNILHIVTRFQRQSKQWQDESTKRAVVYEGACLVRDFVTMHSEADGDDYEDGICSHVAMGHAWLLVLDTEAFETEELGLLFRDKRGNTLKDSLIRSGQLQELFIYNFRGALTESHYWQDAALGKK
ncbi:hypothetical protein jhhlp_007900 [Lomentospora prolificans]|uniref:AAA+ ATPase domain-containing protein n=1 Tax=Lomentospora prolificans TaxID=41688 RepID=A0A2N3N0V6_9PEZI|nr:hypothetical protein jhhlp_007900 [Lomentospora prolificans]